MVILPQQLQYGLISLNSWAAASPQIITIQWQKVNYSIVPENQKEQLEASVVLRGGKDVPGVFYDNIILRQGSRFVAPIGQLAHRYVYSTEILNDNIVYTTPIKVKVLAMFFTSQSAIVGQDENYIQLNVQRYSDGETLCTRTLDASVTTHPGTLEPFSGVITELATIENDALILKAEVINEGMELPDLMITTLWEVDSNV